MCRVGARIARVCRCDRGWRRLLAVRHINDIRLALACHAGGSIAE